MRTVTAVVSRALSGNVTIDRLVNGLKTHIMTMFVIFLGLLVGITKFGSELLSDTSPNLPTHSFILLAH